MIFGGRHTGIAYVRICELVTSKEVRTEIEEGVGEACMSNWEPGKKNSFIARSLI